MIFEYEKPAVEILTFLAQQPLASHAEREARDGTNGGDNVHIGTMPEVNEGVEDW